MQQINTEKELKQILQQGESYTVEFKRSLNKEIKNEICSFVNSSGGKLLVGVDDDGTVCGIMIDNKIRSQLQTSIEAINPRPNVTIDEIDYEGKRIMIINCLADDRKPYMVSGSIFIRVGANSQKLTTPDEVRDFFQETNKIHFDKAGNKNFSYPQDFDKKKFNRFIEEAGITKQLPEKQILKNLKLFSDKDEFLNAGVLMFAKNIQQHHEHASIRCLLFKGINKTLILDDKLVTGSIQEQYEGALQFLKSKLELRYIIETAGPRVEKYEIPEVVYKEAIINALVHRDYYEIGGKIHIEIYDNRLEITNPGGLVSTLKKNEFGKRSVTRNPVIFGLFQRLNLVEQVGSGITRMHDYMKAENLPAPEFSLKGIFVVTLYRPTDFNKWINNWANDLTNNQIKILHEIYKNVEITHIELSKKTGLGTSTITNNIRKLKELGLLVRIGSERKGYWSISTRI